MDYKSEEQTNRILEEKMGASTISEVSCLLCGGRNLQTLFKARSRRDSGRAVYEYISCAECGLAFLNPPPSEHELSISYVEDYSNVEEYGGKISEVFSLLLAKLRARAVTKMKQGFGRLLDVGCGKGFDILELQKRGWDVYGVEITPRVLEIARSKLGRDKIFDKELCECGFQKNSFDIVTMWHVFEHVDNPNSLLREVYRLLKPGGIVIIETPNLNWVLCRLFGDTYASFFVPQHILCWSENSLKMALKHYTFLKVDYPLVNALVGFSNGLSSIFGLFLSEKFEKMPKFRSLSRKFPALFNTALMRVLSFVFLLPLSVLVALISTKTGRGESIRVFAKKENVSDVF